MAIAALDNDPRLEVFTSRQLQIIKELIRENAPGRPESYTMGEVAKMLKVHPKTVKRRVDAKLYPKVPNTGKAVRIPAPFIDGILDSKTTA